MRVVVADSANGLLCEYLSSTITTKGAGLQVLVLSGSMWDEFEARPTDFVVAYVDGLGEISVALSILELLVAGLISQVFLITEFDLQLLLSLADRWESLRFEELMRTNRLQIVGTSSDWQTILSNRLVTL